MTAQDIIAAYERFERSQGGPANANAKMCAEMAAEALRLPYSEVREVLMHHWAGLAG